MRVADQDYVEGFRGSVNRWECDENDHLNVRFYNRIAWECLYGALPAMGVMGSWQMRWVHMRFLAEARLATPIVAGCALVSNDADALTVLVAVSRTDDSAALAYFLCQLDVSGGLAKSGRSTPVAALPPGAGPRSLAADDRQPSAQTAAQAEELGMVPIGRGTVRAEECDALGELPFYAFVGRTSDAMPNLWSHLQAEALTGASSDAFLGGAVLEYGVGFDGSLRAGARFEIWSGVRDVGAKTQHFEHALYDADSGRCVMSAQAISVILDLTTRRTVAIPDARRARLQRLLIQSSAP